jgi:drug/metabolite transporter (DMT)-like permease
MRRPHTPIATGHGTIRDARQRVRNVRFYIPVALAAVATAIYHVAQKAIPRDAHPGVSLVATYLTALSLTLVGLLVVPTHIPLRRAFYQLGWAPYAVGASIVLVELAFLLAYRWGWQLSLASVVSNVATAVCLLLLGLLALGEELAFRQFLGMAFCLVGLVLMMRG